MKWLRSIRLIVPVLVVACCSAALAVSESRTESHPAAAHCPASGADGASSEAACACACCPGQTTVSLPDDVGLVLAALPVCRHSAPSRDERRPDDPVRSIFHPPRRLTPA
jgi:hypothetical protein